MHQDPNSDPFFTSRDQIDESTDLTSATFRRARRVAGWQVCRCSRVSTGVFDSITEELRSPQVGILTCPNTRETLDPTMYGLAASVMPLLALPQEASALFVDHMFDAIAVHLAFKYGGVNPKGALPAGGLRSWQQRRVNEITAREPEQRSQEPNRVVEIACLPKTTR
jgi:hypothetical protein